MKPFHCQLIFRIFETIFIIRTIYSFTITWNDLTKYFFFLTQKSADTLDLGYPHFRKRLSFLLDWH